MDWIKEILSNFIQQYPKFRIDFWIIFGLIGQASDRQGGYHGHEEDSKDPDIYWSTSVGDFF
jgi:hypothetical protein